MFQLHVFDLARTLVPVPTLTPTNFVVYDIDHQPLPRMYGLSLFRSNDVTSPKYTNVVQGTVEQCQTFSHSYKSLRLLGSFKPGMNRMYGNCFVGFLQDSMKDAENLGPSDLVGSTRLQWLSLPELDSGGMGPCWFWRACKGLTSCGREMFQVCTMQIRCIADSTRYPMRFRPWLHQLHKRQHPNFREEQWRTLLLAVWVMWVVRWVRGSHGPRLWENRGSRLQAVWSRTWGLAWFKYIILYYIISYYIILY